MSWLDKFIVIAHRGASALEPENTLRALRRAIDLGADAVEFDIRRSKDGTPIVIHDEDLRRVAGIDLKVCNLTVEELKKIKVFGSESLLTLDDVLAELGNKVPMFIEVKDEGIEEKVTKSIKQYNVVDNVLIISFNYGILSKIKEFLSNVYVGLLTYRYPIPIDRAVKLGAVAILPRYNLVSPRIVKELKSKKLKVYTWVVNDVALALKIISYGVDGIATDNPSIKTEIQRQRKLTKYF